MRIEPNVIEKMNHNSLYQLLGIRYIMPARSGVLHCKAQTIHKTGRLSFVRAEITDPDEHVVASGQSTFRLIKMDFF